MRSHGQRVHGLVLLKRQDVLSETARLRERREAKLRAAGVHDGERRRRLSRGRARLLDGRQPRGFAILLDDVHHELERLPRVVADVVRARLVREITRAVGLRGFGEVRRELPERNLHRGRLRVPERAVEVEEDRGVIARGHDDRGAARGGRRRERRLRMDGWRERGMEGASEARRMGGRARAS
eukprot:31404-Pelagococcus_subviridis.AAC.4